MRKTKVILFAFTLFFMSVNSQDQNPLLGPFTAPHGAAPFDKIRAEHFVPAIKVAIDEARTEMAAIENNAQAPSFDNTIVAMEESGRLLSRVSSIFFNLLGPETSPELQAAAQEISPMLTAWGNDISLNPKLFERVKAVYEQKEKLKLTPEQAMLLENSYKGFVRNGANLDDAGKKRYREISEKLSKLSLDFGNNVLAETNSFRKQVIDKGELAGIPDDVLEAAAERAKAENKEGYVFDLSQPTYISVMKYAENRTLRQEFYMAYMTKSYKDNEKNNSANITDIVNLKLELANLLGYKNYAAFALERRMAENSKNVYKLLDDLLAASMPAARKEVKEVQNYAASKSFTGTIMPWDWSFYSDKLRDEKYTINDELLKPYFKLENVIKGVFGLATDLYGITFKENRAIPVYNPEVIPYEVFDEKGRFLAVLYADFHPRESKRGGAWMNDIFPQYTKNGEDIRPHIMIVMNFTKSTPTKPALLTFDEVTTFLHEFGHSLHGMLSRCNYESLSGTSVYRDFVELPSQIMENWALEKAFLDKFAVHYQTGEKIPADLVKRIVASQNFNAGNLSLRQLSFGYLDMAWHTIEKPFSGDVKAFEDKAWDETRILPPVPGTCMSTQFGHLFSGGYAAGYYSYKWAEVLDADAFAVFKQKGIFDKKTAARFRKEILEKGGTEHPMVLYKRFRGQEPSTDALLIRSGLK